MSTVRPRPAVSTTVRDAPRHAPVIPADRWHEPPDSLAITAEVLRAFRTHGWRYTEQRLGRWHYLILRGHDQSAAYKLIGPLFDETGGYYQGYRIA
jgi:hypothetical protein